MTPAMGICCLSARMREAEDEALPRQDVDTEAVVVDMECTLSKSATTGCTVDMERG